MGFDVVIAPSLAEAETWRKRSVEGRKGGSFGQVVTTFDAWVADLWELQGDGRLLVNAVQREVLMCAAARECVGMEQFAAVGAQCMREAAGLPSFEQAINQAREGSELEGFSEGERTFAVMLGRYEDVLREHGLVEPGHAAAHLVEAQGRVFPRARRVLASGPAPMSALQEWFFDSCDNLEVVKAAEGEAGVLDRAPEGVELRFAFPSGKLAQPGLIADCITSVHDASSIVVTCEDPLGLFGRLEDRLSEEGTCLRVRASKPFAQTDFGRAYLALYQCLHDDPWDPALLSDVLLSPFSGMSRSDAVKADVRIRANRVLSREEALASLRASSEPFSQLEELASDPDADVLVGAFEDMVRGMTGRGEAWCAEQLAACQALRSTTAAARLACVGIDVCASVLERVSLSVSAQVGEGGRTVLVTTQALASQLESGGCSLLVAADLTSQSYAVADKDDAKSTFLEKAGVAPGESALSRARRQFRALLRLPVQSVLLVRPLGDQDADETYPSVVLEEFVDAYRDDPTATDDINNAYRLPACLLEGVVERGEELLFANAVAGTADAVQGCKAQIPEPCLDDLRPGYAKAVMPERRDGAGNVLARPCPSPSQIELFLECPYQWFASRRLNLDELDEGFGPLERGTFAHAALEEFYREFQAAGYLKVDAQNLDEARVLMREVTQRIAAAQAALEPGSGRLVPAGELERREVDALCRQLVDYLDFEAKLLPTFHPAYLEYKIDADHSVDYAGYSLVGQVDRIDVDGRGNAVIIDYKGSVNAEHEVGGKHEGHAGKVQTRIYAQVVKRALGLNVVAALYVSYGRRPSVSGAYDPRVIEAAHLPNVKTSACSCGLLDQVPDPVPDDFSYADLAFDCMLNETESLVGKAIGAMVAGEISPEPSHARACGFCPVLACPKRGA